MGIFTNMASVSSIFQINQNNWFYKSKASLWWEMAHGCTQEEFRVASVTLTYPRFYKTQPSPFPDVVSSRTAIVVAWGKPHYF